MNRQNTIIPMGAGMAATVALLMYRTLILSTPPISKRYNQKVGPRPI